MEKDPRFERKMHYADDGTPLGYIWQCAKGYDPFAEWREGWAETKRLAKEAEKQPNKKPKKVLPDYGYGKGRYMGD
jgi:hypothetical protein